MKTNYLFVLLFAFTNFFFYQAAAIAQGSTRTEVSPVTTTYVKNASGKKIKKSSITIRTFSGTKAISNTTYTCTGSCGGNCGVTIGCDAQAFGGSISCTNLTCGGQSCSSQGTCSKSVTITK